jgi:DNA modification methylase
MERKTNRRCQKRRPLCQKENPRCLLNCNKCGCAIHAFACPKCGFDNKTLAHFVGQVMRTLPPDWEDEASVPTVPDEGHERPHWHDRRCTYQNGSKLQDRGIIPPLLPDGFTPDVSLKHGDSETQLKMLPDDSYDSCITSVPYYVLRSYNVKNDIGLLGSIPAYLSALVGIFRQVKRVLKPNGTLWVDIGDSYCGSGGHSNEKLNTAELKEAIRRCAQVSGIQRKSKLGIPGRLQAALIDDGWICRQEIILARNNWRPEGAFDRPDVAHNQLYFFAKGESNYYKPLIPNGYKRALASVWTLYNHVEGFGCHPAPMILDVCRWAVRMGCPKGGRVLDPFCGSGTTGHAALENGCHFTGIDASAAYLKDTHQRLIARKPRKPEKRA